MRRTGEYGVCRVTGSCIFLFVDIVGKGHWVCDSLEGSLSVARGRHAQCGSWKWRAGRRLEGAGEGGEDSWKGSLSVAKVVHVGTWTVGEAAIAWGCGLLKDNRSCMLTVLICMQAS
jgi:hypothetical protein